MSEIGNAVKQGLKNLALKTVANVARGKISTRGYSVEISIVVEATKKVLTRMISQAKKKSFTFIRFLLPILSKAGICPGSINITGSCTETKMLKAGKYELLVTLIVQAENKKILQDVVKGIEAKAGDLKMVYPLLAVIGIAPGEVGIESFDVKIGE